MRDPDRTLRNFLLARPLLLPAAVFLLGARVAILRPEPWVYLGLCGLLLVMWSVTGRFSVIFRWSLRLGFVFLLLYFQLYRVWQTNLLREATLQTSYFTIKIETVSPALLKQEVSGVARLLGTEAEGLRLHFRGPAPQAETVLPGQIYNVRAKSRRLSGSRLPGAFDSAAWLVKQGVFCQITWQQARNVTLLEEPTTEYWPTRLFMRARAYLTSQMIEKSGQEAGSVLGAMLYGDESFLAKDAEDEFQAFGLTHVLVASGTNVSLCLSSLRPLTKKAFRKPEVRLRAEILGLLLLTCLSLGQAAMLRASLMKIIELLHRRQKMRTFPDNYLYLSIFAVALLRPWLLVNTGFLMSCFATQAVYLQIEGEGGETSLSWPKQQAAAIVGRLKLYLGIQVILLPFLWRPGRFFTLAEVLANLFLLPLTELLLLWAFAFLLFLPLAPVASWLGLALRMLYQLFSSFLEAGSVLVAFGFYARRIHLILLPFLPLGKLFTRLPRLVPERKNWKIGMQAFSALVILLVCLGFHASVTGLYFLDAGQGDASLFWTGNQAILIDGGPPGFAKDLRSFLDYLEIRTLDYAFVSHLDQDHVAGLSELMAEGYPVGTLFFSQEGLDPERLATFRKEEEKGRTQLIFPETGQVIRIEDIAFEILASGERARESNDASLVFTSTQAGLRMLWMGDAGVSVEKRLLQEGARVIADLLHVSHHGSKSGSSEVFVQAVAPSISIISCGYQNRYGHPDPEVVLRLESVSRVVRTDEEASLHLRVGGKAALASTRRENYLPSDYARIMGTEDD